jgi:hypothetical protein
MRLVSILTGGLVSGLVCYGAVLLCSEHQLLSIICGILCFIMFGVMIAQVN